jgi:serine/threonine protein kinase
MAFPSVVAGYRIVGPLSPECSTVFSAQCLHTKEQVVIKVLSLANYAHLREAQIIGMLYHRHVVRLIEQVQHADRLLLVMQTATGGDLLQLISSAPNGVLGISTARRVFAQLVLALDYLHANHVVHRYV